MPTNVVEAGKENLNVHLFSNKCYSSSASSSSLLAGLTGTNITVM
jgi:hypothetical protein